MAIVIHNPVYYGIFSGHIPQGEPLEVIQVVILLVGAYAIAALLRAGSETSAYGRRLLLVGGRMIIPGMKTDIMGLALIIVGYLIGSKLLKTLVQQNAKRGV